MYVKIGGVVDYLTKLGIKDFRANEDLDYVCETSVQNKDLISPYERKNLRFDTFGVDFKPYAIGTNGYSTQLKKSYFATFDIDFTKRDGEYAHKFIQAAKELDFLTIFSSTSGLGYHLYAPFFAPVRSESKMEHEMLCLEVLLHMCRAARFPFNRRMDACGRYLWVFNTKKSDKGLKHLQTAKIGVKL
jgi:hypothetical protein